MLSGRYRKNKSGVWTRSDYAPFDYSDGDEVEERLLNQLQETNDISLASDELQRLMVDWPSEYHFSPLRANLLSPFRLEQFPKILEIGSGCGAVTRQLGETCPDSEILALEGSMRRAQISLARCRGLENVEVCCDSFADFSCEDKFDLITLIGVLEYSPSFFSTTDPIKKALNRARLLLNQNGVLVVAIENQLGLKYFNGCPEDHNGKTFFGINDQYLDGPVKTFGKKQLELLFHSAGFQRTEFVYPFPDYKLPRLLLREEALSSDVFDIAYLIGQYPARNYGGPSDKLFRESRAWKLLAENDLVRDFSNSFLVFAYRGDTELKDFSGNWLCHSFSGQRRKRYLARNEFSGEAEQISVKKYLCYPSEAKDAPSDLIVNQRIEKEEYHDGIPYGYLLLDLVAEDNPLESFIEYLRPWVNVLIEKSFKSTENGGDQTLLLPGTLYDCIPINLILDSDERLVVFDQEWVFAEHLELGFILFRGILGCVSSNLDFFEQVGLFENESVIDIITNIFRAFDIPFNDDIYRKYIECEVEVQCELVPYHGDKAEFRGIWESFFKEERSKRSTLSELVGSVSVRHYEFLSRQYDFWHKEGKILLGEIEKLDKRLQERTQELGESNEEISELILKVRQRNATISNIHRSFSWQITEPLRLAGYLIRGDFIKAAASFKQIKISVVQRLQEIPKLLLLLVKKAKSTESKSNKYALEAIADERCRYTKNQPVLDPLTSEPPANLPCIDISAVTYNSEKWIEGFVDSLLHLEYPKDLLTIHFVDNSSEDATVDKIELAVEKLKAAGCIVLIYHCENSGYGAGQNVAIREGSAPYCLITNVDLVFDPKSLLNVVATAVADDEEAAAWELRQSPFEHPKFYDPVTGLTNWNSHACILFRRSILESVGCYDETLFMYGEDVELSYRLRRSGASLRYCPRAVVEHYSYDHVDQVKPLQYKGSTFANLYIRLKYGNAGDIWSIPFLAAQLILAPSPFPKARWMTIQNLSQLAIAAPKALWSRKKPTGENVSFPFRTWDYDLVREGAFVEQSTLPSELPLVTIITRTYRGRELYLRQAMLSVAHQSYPNIEHIIVEDGGNTLESTVFQVGDITGCKPKFIEIEKLGRSVAGNTGLQQAQGKYCLMLDDDDLLFGDHVELLVGALHNEPDAVAAYSLAWEVQTDVSGLSVGHYQEDCYEVPEVLQEKYDYQTLTHHNLMAIQSILFERQLFNERGGFDADLDVLEDWVLWVCYGYNNKIVRLPKVTSLFRTPQDLKVRDERQKKIDIGYQPARNRAKERIEKINQLLAESVNLDRES